jgi:hypothetical protein
LEDEETLVDTFAAALRVAKEARRKELEGEKEEGRVKI